MKRILIIFCALMSLVIISCATTDKSMDGMSQGTMDSMSKKITMNDLNGKEFMLDNMYKDMKITIGFEKDRVYGFAGVNRYMSSYKLNGNKISLTAVASTMMAGPEKNMKAEDAYLKMLNNSDMIMLDGNMLTIKTKNGESLMYKQTK